MKTIIINASPKPENSNTQIFLKGLTAKLPENEVYIRKLNEVKTDEIKNCSSLIFAFPLYVDSLPSGLLKLLCSLENIALSKTITVFAVANNGFFEGTQNQTALDIIKNWCDRAGVTWGQGIGIGAGEMGPSVSNIPLKKSPFVLLDSAFDDMAFHIRNRSSAENIFVSPKILRFIWKMAGEYEFFLPKARKKRLEKKGYFFKKLTSVYFLEQMCYYTVW